MPIASTQQYLKMLKSAKDGKYAYPAINVANIEGLNAALQAFAETKSDGIVQLSTGAGEHCSGSLKDMAIGAKIMAEAAHELAERYPVYIVLHTDHCVHEKLGKFLDPLIEASKNRVAKGLKPLFNSHMFDGSELSLEDNLKISKKYIEILKPLGMLLEMETGVVGGEEDGIDNSGAPKEKLYTSPEEMIRVYETLSKYGEFLYAATFGNVHGVYKPGNVKLKPKILQDGQAAVQQKFNSAANPLNLVFHGGSGSLPEEIQETLGYGVIKMNVDTDTQYAFTRPIADHMLKNYDGVLKIDAEVGNKKMYDPRGYMKKGLAGMKDRIAQAVKDLNGEGKTLFK
jgi:fructose-bisphosphate aldolase class II